MRMYLMWAEAHRYKAEIIDREEGDVAGVQTVTIHIKGEYVYGYLRGETVGAPPGADQPVRHGGCRPDLVRVGRG